MYISNIRALCLRLSSMVFPCLLLFSCCVFGFCCFSAVTHLTLKPWVPTQVTFCTFRILFSWLCSISHLFARFQVECHERACSSGSLAGQVAMQVVVKESERERESGRDGRNWSLGLLISRLAGATYPLSVGARN